MKIKVDDLLGPEIAAFLEEQFRIELAAHELSADYLNTVTDIVKLVESKRASA